MNRKSLGRLRLSFIMRSSSLMRTLMMICLTLVRVVWRLSLTLMILDMR